MTGYRPLMTALSTDVKKSISDQCIQVKYNHLLLFELISTVLVFRPVATALVQSGTLKRGSVVVAGTGWAKVSAITQAILF